jgi:UDP-N-acetylmuramate--alanine ligase
VINGGIINAYGTNARMGAGDWMVVEADESDGTFLKLPATSPWSPTSTPSTSTTTALRRVREAFRQFVENMPFYGFAVLCIDHPEVQALIGRIETAASSPTAPARRPTCALLDVVRPTAPARLRRRGHRPRGAGERLESKPALPMLGRHNVQNALAAIAVAHEMGIDEDGIRRAGRLRRREAALHPHRRSGASRSSTTTATIRWRSPRC